MENREEFELEEILEVEKSIVEEINKEIEFLADELESLVELSRECPELLKDHKLRLDKIGVRLEESLNNVEESNVELRHASELKKTGMLMKGTVVGATSGLVVGAVGGTFVPVIGTGIGACVGFIGGLVGSYTLFKNL